MECLSSETIENLTRHGPEQPALVDTALGREDWTKQSPVALPTSTLLCDSAGTSTALKILNSLLCFLADLSQDIQEFECNSQVCMFGIGWVYTKTTEEKRSNKLESQVFGHLALSCAVRLTLHREVKGKIPQNQHNNN